VTHIPWPYHEVLRDERDELFRTKYLTGNNKKVKFQYIQRMMKGGRKI